MSPWCLLASVPEPSKEHPASTVEGPPEPETDNTQTSHCPSGIPCFRNRSKTQQTPYNVQRHRDNGSCPKASLVPRELRTQRHLDLTLSPASLETAVLWGWGRSSRPLWAEEQPASVQASKPAAADVPSSTKPATHVQVPFVRHTHYLRVQVLHWVSRQVLREENVSGSIRENLESRTVKGRRRKPVRRRLFHLSTAHLPGQELLTGLQLELLGLVR